MTQKGLLGFLVRFVELYLRVDACLFPEHRNGAADLQVREAVVVNDDNLLGFAEVRHLPLRVKSTSVIPCASLLERTPCDQVVLNLFPYI